MKRALALALAAAGAAAALSAYAATRPDPGVQAQADGCGRDRTAQFRQEAPVWVYVGDRDAPATGPPPAPQWASGILHSEQPSFYAVHPTPIDDPVNHDSYDVILNIRPDPAYASLLGGDEGAHTGNFAGDDEETGRLHTELEQNAYPPFAWPESGDRVTVLGSWVWDCGHWRPGGERTEFHPFRALWVQRSPTAKGSGPSPRSPYGEAEGDLLITTDKTPAGKHEDCAHRTKGDAAAFKVCLAAEPDRLGVNGEYRFTLPAPPRPSPRARLRVRVVDAGSTANAPEVAVTPAGRGATVSVTVDAPAGERVVVAKQVFVGWSPMPPRALPLHLRVTFQELLVRRAMDPGCPPAQPACTSVQTTRRGQITAPPGEWAVYSDVAGVWSPWPLLRPRDGQRVALRRKVDVYVGLRSPWRLFVFARECDFGALSASDPSRPPAPCPKGGEFGDGDGDDSPGAVVDRYPSPAGSVGLHRSDALLEASTCPPANAEGCYRLTYRVELVDDTAKRARASR